jgi:hypothetical protein
MKDRRYAVATHEATHAVIAMKLGLPVEWVSIEHGLEEGIRFQAAVKLPDEKLEMERDRHALLVAMVAPSFLLTYDDDVDAYARLEAFLAYEIARRHGIEPENVYDDAATVVTDEQISIYDLADRLEAEGRVVLEVACVREIKTKNERKRS